VTNMSCSSPPGLWMETLWHACCLTSILIWQIHTLWRSSLQDVWNVTSFKNVMSSRNPSFHLISHHVHPELIPLTSLNQSDCVSNCSLYMRNLPKCLEKILCTVFFNALNSWLSHLRGFFWLLVKNFWTRSIHSCDTVGLSYLIPQM
jgi:hypothetical protein